MKSLSEAAQKVVREGRAGGATAAERARILQNIQNSLARGETGPDIEAPRPHSPWAGKVIGLGALAISVAAAVWLNTRAPTVARDAVAAPAIEQQSAKVAQRLEETPAEMDSRKGAAEPAFRPPARSLPAPQKVEPAVAISPSTVVVPEPEPAPAPVPEPAAAAEAEDSLAAETQGLREIQAALRELQPRQALELIDAQQRRFAGGQLGPERAGAEVLARCAIDRETGRSSLATFVDAHPNSPLLPRLREACK